MTRGLKRWTDKVKVFVLVRSLHFGVGDPSVSCFLETCVSELGPSAYKVNKLQ